MNFDFFLKFTSIKRVFELLYKLNIDLNHIWSGNKTIYDKVLENSN